MDAFHQDREEMETFLDFMEEDLENVRRVVKRCRDEDVDIEFEIHAKAETVEESVESTEVDRAQIIKTLVFSGEDTVAVMSPGDTSVEEEKLEDFVGTDLELASPSEVEKATGYVVGGVSPFDLEIPVYMDESILENDVVRPAAGSRVVGAIIDPEALKQLTGAEVVDVTR